MKCRALLRFREKKRKEKNLKSSSLSSGISLSPLISFPSYFFLLPSCYIGFLPHTPLLDLPGAHRCARWWHRNRNSSFTLATHEEEKDVWEGKEKCMTIESKGSEDIIKIYRYFYNNPTRVKSILEFHSIIGHVWLFLETPGHSCTWVNEGKNVERSEKFWHHDIYFLLSWMRGRYTFSQSSCQQHGRTTT